jgi:hypothetical protein
MFLLLASCLSFLAQVPPPANNGAVGTVQPTVIIPDTEVPKYLRSAELSEWGNAMRAIEAGRARVQTGAGIVASAGTARTTKGAFAETPDQVKARGEKIIAEGNAAIARAQPSVTRLRNVAATRQMELTKTVDLGVDLPQKTWNEVLSLSAVRLQKQARDLGYQKLHLIGAATFMPDGTINRSLELAEALRGMWTKLDDKLLVAAPADGYSYKAPATTDGMPTLVKGMTAPTAVRQMAYVWAEVYPLTADGSVALMMVSLADAYNMRVIGEEIYLTTATSQDKLAKTYLASFSLKDEHSYIPRLASSGDWVLGFDQDTPGLANVLMRYISVKVSTLGVGANAPIAAVAGGDSAVKDAVRGNWTVARDNSAAGLARAYRVTGTVVGQSPTEVGQLLFKLEEAAKPTGK